MASCAHSTRTSLLPVAGILPPLLSEGPKPQLGPVTRALQIMRAGEPKLPAGTAAQATDDLLDSYDAWLEFERRWLQWERYRDSPVLRLALPFRSQMTGWDEYDFVPRDNAGARFHGSGAPPASLRAALVLRTVGCEWRDGPPCA